MAEKKAAAKKSASSPKSAPAAEGPLAQIFGVRHLSPSGAWHLQRYLDAVKPTAVLIEGPSDATDLIEHLAHKKTRPPVAVLAFTQQRPVRSILYPLAQYSPEWVAATSALRAKCLVRFMDLPASVFLGLQEQYNREDAKAREAAKSAPETPPDETAKPAVNAETRAYLDDPYEQIALLSGDPDHDTWWEKHFEHTREEHAYRDAIHEFGRGLREIRKDEPRHERETLVREAYMRRVIRQTIAEGHDPSRIVVVCGAFHSTALVGELEAMTDAQLKDLPSLPTTLTIMPYSYYRLSAQSGYGAGNNAPGYYQALWEESQDGNLARLPARYMAEVAGHLRKHGNVRSSADVIEAVRLARTLAALSGDATHPTLRDLRDAATTCLGHGDRATVARWLTEVEVGDAIGSVPPGVARTSVQDDFYHLAKALKLEEYLKDKEQPIKGNAGDALDLRENRFVKSADSALRDKNRSIFLHRLAALGIPFATLKEADESEQGSYKERWIARWTPECEIQLVENALRGDTIEMATVRAFEEKLAAVDDVAAAAKLAEDALHCDLPDAMIRARERTEALSVDSGNFKSMATAAVRIAHTARYPGVTRVDVAPLQPLAAQLFLRGVLLAPTASRCDDDAAREVGHGMASLQMVANFEDWSEQLATDRWYTTLNTITDDDGNNPYVAGASCALLLERGIVDDEALDRRVARRISPGMDPAVGAGYFEGLASRNHMALLSRKKLWRSLSEFVESLDDDAFRRAVVGMRRAFASFEVGEVRRVGSILAEVWGGGANELQAALATKLDAQEAAALEQELGDLGDLDL